MRELQRWTRQLVRLGDPPLDALDMENRAQVMCTFSGEIQVAFEAFANKSTPGGNRL